MTEQRFEGDETVGPSVGDPAVDQTRADLAAQWAPAAEAVAPGVPRLPAPPRFGAPPAEATDDATRVQSRVVDETSAEQQGPAGEPTAPDAEQAAEAVQVHAEQAPEGEHVDAEQAPEAAPVADAQQEAEQGEAHHAPEAEQVADAQQALAAEQGEADHAPEAEQIAAASAQPADQGEALVPAPVADPQSQPTEVLTAPAWGAAAAAGVGGLISEELAPALAAKAPASEAKTPKLTLGDQDLYREAPAEAVSQATPAEVDEDTRQLSEEERRLNAERAARREARAAALAAADAPPPAPVAPVVDTRRNTDRFAGGLGLFLLRLVVAAIMAVHGLGIVTNLPAAQETFAATRIPEPGIMAIATGVSALAIAVALVFGLMVRVAGLGVLLIAAGALIFVQWGPWSPFVEGRPGFTGELELLLAAVGLLFMLTGGGGFGLDRSFRKSREKDKVASAS